MAFAYFQACTLGLKKDAYKGLRISNGVLYFNLGCEMDTHFDLMVTTKELNAPKLMDLIRFLALAKFTGKNIKVINSMYLDLLRLAFREKAHIAF
jgi:hypothetical protein